MTKEEKPKYKYECYLCNNLIPAEAYPVLLTTNLEGGTIEKHDFCSKACGMRWLAHEFPGLLTHKFPGKV